MEASRRNEPRLQSLGAWLREAREAQELSLADAEVATRIRRKFLEALEDGRWGELPNEIVGRGFLRNYATFLGLDPDDALTRWSGAEPEAPFRTPERQEAAGEPGDKTGEVSPAVSPSVAAPAERREKAPERRTEDYDLLEEELFEPRRVPWLRILGVVLLVVLLGAVGFVSWAYWNNPELLASLGLLSPTETATPTDQPIARITRISATPSDTPSATPAPTATPTLRATRTSTPSPTITSTLRPTPSAGLELFFRTLDRCWVDIYVDGENALTDLLEPNIVRAFQARNEIRLTIGDAGALEVTVNGQWLGYLGSRGDIVHVTWTLQEGSILQAYFTPTPVPPGPGEDTPQATATEELAATPVGTVQPAPAEIETPELSATASR